MFTPSVVDPVSTISSAVAVHDAGHPRAEVVRGAEHPPEERRAAAALLDLGPHRLVGRGPRAQRRRARWSPR